MAFVELHAYSRALNVQTTVYVILPESAAGIGVDAADPSRESLPKTLYLLHGYSDDHSIWMRRTNVERYAAAHHLAVVMPAVMHSFYTNEAHGERYWDYVAWELPETIDSFFKLSQRPEDTYVAGLSMGGYGAMKLALTFPERYAAAGSFSGALDVAALCRGSSRHSGDVRRIFGEDTAVEGSDSDLFHLLSAGACAPEKPKLYVSCGTADFLFAQHQRFCEAAKQAGWDILHREKPDATHEWSFWDEEIHTFIDRYCAC